MPSAEDTLLFLHYSQSASFFPSVTCWNGEWDSASPEMCSQGWCCAHTIGSLTGNRLGERRGCRGSASHLMSREWSYPQGSAAAWGKGFCCAVETASPSNVGIRGKGEREFAATQLFSVRKFTARDCLLKSKYFWKVNKKSKNLKYPLMAWEHTEKILC